MIIELKNKEVWNKTVLEAKEIISPYLVFESLQIWQSLYNYKPFFLACEDKGKIKSVMPVLLDEKNHILTSLPFKYLGGATCSDDYEEYLQYIENLSKKENIKIIYLSFLPFKDYDSLKKLFYLRGYNINYGSYYLVNNIQNKKYEEIKKGFSRSTQRNIKKGQQSNVIIRNSIPSKESINFFYQIYLETMQKNKAKNIFPIELFDHFVDSKYLQNREALLDNKVIASSLDFVVGKQIITWFVLFLREFKEYNPASIIYNDIVKYAIENKLHYVNFGPSSWKDSNFEFKQKFGAVPMQAMCAIKGTNIYEQVKVNSTIFLKNFVNYRPKLKNFIKKFCKA